MRRKSYQAKKLSIKALENHGIQTRLTLENQVERKSAELIRKLSLRDYFVKEKERKFDKCYRYTSASSS